jgi:hypothetical protein
MEFMKRFFLLLALVVHMGPLFAAAAKEEWRLTTADISLVTDNASQVKTEGTLLGELLKVNNRSLWSMQEENGTILTIVIAYQPIDQNVSIKQVGFFRTFSLTIQRELQTLGIMYKPIQTKIAYVRDKPLVIRFFINKTLLDAPPLVSKPN